MADQDKKMKYLYVMENASENGYDTTKFNNFLQQKFGSKYCVAPPFP